MSNVNACAHCGKPLANKRSHARTCNSSCRNHAWRFANAGPVSIKVVLSRIEFNQLKTEADGLGVLVNQLLAARSRQPITNIGVSL